MSALAAEFVALFQGQPAAIAHMLAKHVDDGTGHCRECSPGGQAGRSVWPCPLHGLAAQAISRPAGGRR
ncbi:MAG: hypothetical protein ACRDXB_19425 [Actinomycetes bacterium]